MTGDSITPDPRRNLEVQFVPDVRVTDVPALRRFNTEPYRVTGPSPPAGTLLLVMVLPAAGFLIGLVTSLFAQWLYLTVVYPIAMGSLAGVVGWALIRIGKARGPIVIGVATVLTAATTMLGLHFGIFMRRMSLLDNQQPGLRATALSNPKFFFLDMNQRAEEGVTIRKPGSGWARGRGVNVGYAGSYVYWAVEVALAGLMVWTILRAAAERPLCEICRRWKAERLLGTLPRTQPDLVLGPLRDGHLLALLADAEPVGPEGLRLKAAFCPECEARATVDVALDEVGLNARRRRQTKRFERVRYAGDVLAFLDARRGPV
jgi:hypothetical protein